MEFKPHQAPLFVSAAESPQRPKAKVPLSPPSLPLPRGIVVVFIAAEEGAEKNVGVDKVLEKGKLEEAVAVARCETEHI